MRSRFRMKGNHFRLLFAVLLCMVFFMGHRDSCTGDDLGTLEVINATGYVLEVKVQGGQNASGPWSYAAPSGDTHTWQVKPSTYTASYREDTFRSQTAYKSTTVEEGKKGTITMTLN